MRKVESTSVGLSVLCLNAGREDLVLEVKLHPTLSCSCGFLVEKLD